MRVVCISDTHGLHDALQTECAIPNGDVFIHAGDFTDTGDRDEVSSRLLQWVARRQLLTAF